MGKSIIKKLATAAVALVVLVGVSSSALASITLNVGAGGPPDNNILGEVIPGVNSSDLPPGSGLDVRDAYMINALLGLTAGWHDVTVGTTPYKFYRSTSIFGSLPAADASTAVGKGTFGGMDSTSNPGFITIQLPVGQTYQYLVAAYDGQQSGAEVWYIGNVALGETILIPSIVNNTGEGGHLKIDSAHQITSWTMYNPVPEPTTMIAGALLLLPFAASTVRFVRKNRKA